MNEICEKIKMCLCKKKGEKKEKEEKKQRLDQDES